MKRNLIKGIILISAVVLSSCSSTSKLAGLKNSANDDDVYYTKAVSGDKQEYIAENNQQNNTNYNGDDDYYYYGDYATRLNRFASATPFDYSDNFYFTYVPYNNGCGAGLDYDPDYYNANHTGTMAANAAPQFDNGYIYSPYDYGYSPYYDMGYDDFGYGDIYAAYLLGGGGGGGYGHIWHRHNNSNVVATNPSGTGRGVRTTPSPGVTRLTTAYPGNPLINVNRNTTGVATRTGYTNNANNNNTARQTRESFRPIQQQQSVAPPPSNNTNSSSSSSSSTSSGGGGRPVRP